MSQSILGFYKGTTFPQHLKLNDKKWKEMNTLWEQCLINGLKAGVSLEQQAEDYFQQMNKIEEFLCKWHKNNNKNSQNIKKLKRDINNTFNKSMDYIMSIWYMDIYMLLRLKKIENNNDYGWVFIKTNM
tara:strand:- start:1219 stop:1605 length:387 start_codon:yes stop_codon:yes gene_type:complete